ncbi:MAG: MFS transporter [Gammaproteobacteria bacterium]|nr:MFS transporter [Gammaproteobacteria bacterium]
MFFYSKNMATTLRTQSFIGAAIGTMIEYYDYALFAIFLPLIATQFFPGKDAYEALSNGYYILMISMLGRPLGGAIFGHIGDMIGRPRALLLSMYGIAVTTFIIGITPTYQSIGIWAIVIIVITKFFQIACFGGEYNGAGIYVVEHSKPTREGFSGSALAAIMTSGSIFASLFGVLLTMDFMPSWSWRIAFYVGGLIGVFGVLYRKKLHESPQFKPANNKEHSLRKLIQLYPRQIIAGAFIGGFITIPFTTVLTFVNPVLMTKGFMTAHQLMWLQTLMIAVGVIIILITGKLADYFSARKVMLFGAASLIIFSYPLLLLIDQHSFFWLIFSSIIFVTINDIILGPSNAFLKNIFPPEFRYRGSSLGFTLGMTILGGLTAPIENALYHATGSFAAASLWLIFIGIGSFWSINRASSSQLWKISSLEQSTANNN